MGVLPNMRTLAACTALVVALSLVQAPRPALSARPVAARAAAQPTSADGLVTYHYDLNRSGFDNNEPAFVGLSGQWDSGALDGPIYAEPLVRSGLVYVVTEHNAVYAFNTASGSLAWQRSAASNPLGLFVQNPGNCGISQAGIESTPVLDPTTGTLYLVALIGPNASTDFYQLFALNAATGATLAGYPRVVNSVATFANNHQQRGALALNNATVYVPFGGWGGDCGTYHGTVVGMPLAGGTPLQFQVPTGAAGIWAPGGPAIDSTGNVYVADGNDIPVPTTYQYGDSVLRLSPSLNFSATVADYWAPSDWHALAAADADIGGIGPALLGNGLVFQGGKNGIGYLLRQASLGGVGAELFNNSGTAVCGGFFSATAYTPPYLYGSCSDKLVALNINTAAPSYSVAWTHTGCGFWSPIVAAGIVWAFDRCGRFHGINATTGVDVFAPVAVTVNHFVSPSTGGGRVFLPLASSLRSYLFAAPPAAGGSYHAVNPTRLYDSRAVAQLGANSTRDIPVQALAGGLITSTPSAVVLNVGVTNPTNYSYLALYPTGSPLPSSSTVNFGPWQTIANLTQVQVGTGGSVTVYNSQGSTDFFLDLAGWYDTGPTAGNVSGLFKALAAPKRVLDTRGGGQLGPNSTRNVQITGAPTGIPMTSASAVVINLTTVDATAPSYLAVYPTGPSVPSVSNVNFPAHTVLPNRAIVAVNNSGSVTIYNSVGSVDVVIDLVGWFTNATPGGTGALFHPLPPRRLLDTRPATHIGQYASPWPADTTRDVTVAGLAGTDPAATALAANFTITNADSGSLLTIWPTGLPPLASDLNFGPGWTVANHVVAGLSGGVMRVYNNLGNVDVIVDVNGWYG